MVTPFASPHYTLEGPDSSLRLLPYRLYIRNTDQAFPRWSLLTFSNHKALPRYPTRVQQLFDNSLFATTSTRRTGFSRRFNLQMH